MTRHDDGLSTEIGYGGDANGTALSGRKRGQISRLRREHGRARFDSKAERNLAHGLGELARITSALGLPRSRRERASDIFRSAQSAGLFPGRSIESMAAASVYAACRCAGDHRSLAEIVAVARSEDSLVEQAYKVLNRDSTCPPNRSGHGVSSRGWHPRSMRPRGYGGGRSNSLLLARRLGWRTAGTPQVSPDTLLEAYDISAEKNHDVYDCFYIALAREADADRLLTTDRDFEHLCADESFEYTNPVSEDVLSEFDAIDGG